MPRRGVKKARHSLVRLRRSTGSPHSAERKRPRLRWDHRYHRETAALGGSAPRSAPVSHSFSAWTGVLEWSEALRLVGSALLFLEPWRLEAAFKGVSQHQVTFVPTRPRRRRRPAPPPQRKTPHAPLTRPGLQTFGSWLFRELNKTAGPNLWSRDLF